MNNKEDQLQPAQCVRVWMQQRKKEERKIKPDRNTHEINGGRPSPTAHTIRTVVKLRPTLSAAVRSAQDRAAVSNRKATASNRTSEPLIVQERQLHLVVVVVLPVAPHIFIFRLSLCAIVQLSAFRPRPMVRQKKHVCFSLSCFGSASNQRMHINRDGSCKSRCIVRVVESYAQFVALGSVALFAHNVLVRAVGCACGDTCCSATSDK
jgi:hypothetical protein